MDEVRIGHGSAWVRLNLSGFADATFWQPQEASLHPGQTFSLFLSCVWLLLLLPHRLPARASSSFSISGPNTNPRVCNRGPFGGYYDVEGVYYKQTADSSSSRPRGRSRFPRLKQGLGQRRTCGKTTLMSPVFPNKIIDSPNMADRTCYSFGIEGFYQAFVHI